MCFQETSDLGPPLLDTDRLLFELSPIFVPSKRSSVPSFFPNFDSWLAVPSPALTVRLLDRWPWLYTEQLSPFLIRLPCCAVVFLGFPPPPLQICVRSQLHGLRGDQRRRGTNRAAGELTQAAVRAHRMLLACI